MGILYATIVSVPVLVYDPYQVLLRLPIIAQRLSVL